MTLMMESFFDDRVAITKSNGFFVDDDDAFGDFKFAPASPALNDCRISSSGSDDEWGDFVDCFPPKSVPSYISSDLSLASPGISIVSRPIPLSIFGEDELEAGDEDPPPATDPFSRFSGRQKDTPAVPFGDLISNLYSQAESFKDSSSDDHVRDWKFKDASLDNGCVSQNPDPVASNGLRTENCGLRFQEFIGLYRSLKKLAQKLSLRHLHVLEGNAKIAALSGDTRMAMTLHQDIQAGYTKLNQESNFSLDGPFGDHPITEVDEVLKAVKLPKFQMLEREYGLSNRISLAKDSLSSGLSLFEHASAVLSTMTFGTDEEKVTYVHAWAKIISTCCKELQHGVLIWRKALEDQVDRALLDDTRGMRYFVSLGEIYRISVILKVTCEVYKSWILLCSDVSKEINDHSTECVSMWNVSGLKQVLASISYNRHLGRKTKLLLESIESIAKLDIVSLQNSSSSQAHPLCRLSLLPLNCHGLESVLWDDAHFFLTLANLWANLISPECPQLPHLHNCR